MLFSTINIKRNENDLKRAIDKYGLDYFGEFVFDEYCDADSYSEGRFVLNQSKIRDLAAKGKIFSDKDDKPMCVVLTTSDLIEIEDYFQYYIEADI